MKKRGSKKKNNKNNIVHQPHDKLARKALSDIIVAKELIQKHLPPELVKRIDIDSVQLTNKSFVSEEMKELHSDVIYKCNIDNKQGYIYYEIEHQSTPDKWLPLRIAAYNIQLMQQHINEGHKTLPIIINEIIYAGTESPYPYTIDIFELFENPKLAREFMYKPPIMTDLTTKTQEEILEDGTLGLMEVLLKQGIQREHTNWVLNNIVILVQLSKTSFWLNAIRYLLNTDSISDPNELIKALVKATPEEQERIMTVASKIEQKGRQEGIEVGIEKGIEKEKLDIAKNMLRKHVDINFINDITGLTLEKISALQAGLN